MNIQRFIANNGFGTNMYLVWDEDSKKAFIVDPGAESVQMENAISENKLQPEYIILTHAHGDHTGGIDPLKEKYPGIKLVANRAERKMLAERSRIGGGEGHTADIEVTDGDTLDVGPMHLCFIDCPGHTPGPCQCRGSYGCSAGTGEIPIWYTTICYPSGPVGLGRSILFASTATAARFLLMHGMLVRSYCDTLRVGYQRGRRGRTHFSAFARTGNGPIFADRPTG